MRRGRTLPPPDGAALPPPATLAELGEMLPSSVPDEEVASQERLLTPGADESRRRATGT